MSQMIETVHVHRHQPPIYLSIYIWHRQSNIYMKTNYQVFVNHKLLWHPSNVSLHEGALQQMLLPFFIFFDLNLSSDSDIPSQKTYFTTKWCPASIQYSGFVLHPICTIQTKVNSMIVNNVLLHILPVRVMATQTWDMETWGHMGSTLGEQLCPDLFLTNLNQLIVQSCVSSVMCIITSNS